MGQAGAGEVTGQRSCCWRRRGLAAGSSGGGSLAAGLHDKLIQRFTPFPCSAWAWGSACAAAAPSCSRLSRLGSSLGCTGRTACPCHHISGTAWPRLACTAGRQGRAQAAGSRGMLHQASQCRITSMAPQQRSPFLASNPAPAIPRLALVGWLAATAGLARLLAAAAGRSGLGLVAAPATIWCIAWGANDAAGAILVTYQAPLAHCLAALQAGQRPGSKEAVGWWRWQGECRRYRLVARPELQPHLSRVLWVFDIDLGCMQGRAELFVGGCESRCIR